MPNLNEMFPSKYLKADDLPDSGLVVEIDDLTMETFKGKDGDEDKWLLHFKEEEKGLILNKTNGKTLTKLFGPESKDWMGKKVRLVSQEVEAFGERTMAIRVSLQKVSSDAKAKEESLAKDDIPF